MKITGYPYELAQRLFELDKDKKYTITEYKKIRGTQANRYFHKLVNELAKYNRSTGYAIGDEEMKIEINTSYGTLSTFEDGRIKGAKVPKGTNIQEFYPYAKKYKTEGEYECYIFYKRTSELDTKEFWQLIKGLEKECHEVGIETLEDEELKEIMRAYDKDYQERIKSGN